MKTRHRHKGVNTWSIALACLATLLLLGGGMVYVAFRSISLPMFGWFESLGVMDGVEWIRMMSRGLKPSGFLLYNLPDLLWITSYLMFVNALIPKNDRRSYLFWSLSVPLLAILHEIMQGIGIAAGSFDCIDLLCYIIPTGINITMNHYIYFTAKRKRIKNQRNPKFNHQLNTVHV
ncbi:MAG: hypothetical protein K2J58_07475 [Muribaculaceae bacterium]|nr:hypothetical protein [Muribaculaceae bacterium]